MLAISEARKEPMFQVWSPKSEVWSLKYLHGFRTNRIGGESTKIQAFDLKI
jgi:hypothetical protein